jgi:hypothetical protein
MAAKTLAELRDLVEGDLTDASNETWSTDEIDRAIRRALYRYSEVRPLQAETSVSAAASREYDLSSISGLVDVERVWFPYDSDDPEHPPTWVGFELWEDGNPTLYLKVEDEPTASDDPLRVFYTKLHTLNGLDGESSSTYYVEDEECLVLGATGYAAVQRSRYVVDTVNPSVATPENWRSWGNARLREFEAELERVARKRMRHLDSRVAVDVEV